MVLLIETVRADAIMPSDVASRPETDWKQPRRVHDVGRFAEMVVLIVEDEDGNYDYNRKVMIALDRAVQRHS